MPPARVVPALDEVEDRQAGVGLRGEALPIEQLALERREETFAEGVVVGVADRAHGGPDARLATPEPEGDRRVLGALVRVMDDIGGPALGHGHLERAQDELGAEMRFHRPADHATAPRIEDDGEIEKPRPCRAVRDVRHPQAIGTRRGEVAGDEIWRGRICLVSDGCPGPLPSTDAAHAEARMSRATRFWPTRIPRAASSACTRGAP